MELNNITGRLEPMGLSTSDREFGSRSRRIGQGNRAGAAGRIDPGRIRDRLERRGAIERDHVQAPWRLTEKGKRALAYYGQNLLGREPNAAERLAGEIEQLKKRYHERRAQGLPPDRDAIRIIERKQQILRNLGKNPADVLKGLEEVEQVRLDAAAAASVTPPKVYDLVDESLGSIVREYAGRLAEGLRREREAGLPTPGLSTERRLGYVPRVLTEPKGLGGLVRKMGMSLERELAASQGLTTQVLNEMNKTRSELGLASLKADSDEVQQVVSLLMREDIAPHHQSQIMRVMARENTAQELEDLLRQVGQGQRVDEGLFRDPIEAWMIRRHRTVDAMAAVDIIKAAAAKFGKRVKSGATLEAGWSHVEVPGFGSVLKEFAFPEADAKALARVLGTYRQPNKVLKAWDQLTSFWKTLVLSVPSYTTANAWSDGFMMLAGDMFDPRAVDQAWAAMRDYHDGVKAARAAGIDERNFADALATAESGLAEKLAPLARKIDGTEYSVGQLIDALKFDHGYMGAGLYGTEMEQAVRSLVTDPTGWNPGDQFKAALGDGPWWKRAARAIGPGYAAWFRAVNTAMEDHRHLAAVIARLKKGDTLDQAVSRAKQFLFDYSDLSQFEKDVMKRVFPFWAWIRNNTRVMWYLGAARPQTVALFSKIRGNLEASLVEDGELLAPSLRPRHVQGELGVQVSGGRYPQFVNMGRMYPLKELGYTLPGLVATGGKSVLEGAVEGFNPFAKGAIEGAINRDLYWGRPITAYEGQRSEWLGMKLPPAAKRWLRMVRPLNVIEQATWQTNATGTGMATAAGFRTFPVDVHRQVSERDRAINEQIGRVKSDLRRALYKGDEAEAQRLAGIYQDLAGRRSGFGSKFYRALQGAGGRRRRAEIDEQLDAILQGG